MENKQKKAPRNEVHVIDRTTAGHLLDTDCWCEPWGYWHTNIHGVLLFVVTHRDNTADAHDRVVSHRNIEPQDATTKFLNSIYMFEHER